MKSSRKSVSCALVAAIVAYSADAEAAPFDHIAPAATSVDAQMNVLAAALSSNEILVAAEAMSSRTEQTNALKEIQAFNRAVSTYLTEVSSLSGPAADQMAVVEVSKALVGHAELRQSEWQLKEGFKQLLVKVGTHQYEGGPSSVAYIADRTKILADIVTYQEAVTAYVGSLGTLRGALSGVTTLPAVIVELVSLVSDQTGEQFITISGTENFRLRVRVRNAGAVALTNISAALSIQTELGSVTAQTNMVMPVGAAGSLAPDDGVPGSGPDEAEVEWSLVYSGALRVENVHLTVTLLENGVEPTSFVEQEMASFLQVHADADLDLMPDEWEVAHGLDPTTDDSQSDLDGDGLSNGRERELGTNPNNTDTDDDGLSDLEELTVGVDGHITDPTQNDTDQDGTLDAVDAAPTDAASTTAEPPVGEAVVGVSVSEVVLSNTNPEASVAVTNAGAGTLHWLASVDNDAAARLVVAESVSNGRPSLVGPGTITVAAAAPGHDFDTTAGLTTTLRVLDMYGSDKDVQLVRICHVQCATAPQLDGGTDETDGETMGGRDASNMPTTDAGPGPGPQDDKQDGCGCHNSGSPDSSRLPGLIWFVILGSMARRRRAKPTS